MDREQTTSSSWVPMDYDLSFSDPMTQTCAAMLGRPGRANGAQRRWRHLLRDAHREQDARRTRRYRRIPPNPD